jgi:4'-phosphopantetheinyl transferase
MKMGKEHHQPPSGCDAINWAPPPPACWTALTENEVHVWAAALDLAPEKLAWLAAALSPDELARAERFRFPQLRTRFTAARGQLRKLLGQYLQLDPASLEFAYTARGKPGLAGAAAGRLHFNLAHSQDLALIAVTRLAPLGVDVEKIRPMPDALAIAERFFSTAERAAFETLPSAAHDVAFFHLWTRKEAWLKATGDGIAESLSKIEVAFLPGEPARVRAIAGDAAAGDAWSLCELNPAGGFVGAVAIPSRQAAFECWRAELSSLK